jgi:tRNA nucleotidyltransferase (CCA-adding enzyme)
MHIAAARFLSRLQRPVALLVGHTRLKHFMASMATGKLDTQTLKALLTPDLLLLESIFRNNGYGFRLVGGVVRDLLLDKTPKDIDIATECRPDVMMRIFEANGIRYIPTGLQHGTVTAHINHRNYEITTLRLDRVTDGRHAVVEFTKDWREDAERRDLTINAMSLDLQGNLYDYFSGEQHLAEKKVVFVGDARKRICEDFLRILRYFRFYGRISPSPDRHNPATLEAIRETAEGLTAISAERIWMEMAKILQGNHAPHLLRTMYDLQVARHIGEQRRAMRILFWC